MRILHINCNYIGTTLHQLMIEQLDGMGVINEVFVPTYDKSLAVIKPNDNVTVSECFRKWERAVFDYKQHKIISAIEKKYDIKSFDLIHAYTLFTDGNVARYLSEKYGVPYVVAVRNTDVNDFFRLMVHLRGRGIRIMKDAQQVFFLSDSYRKQVFGKYVPAKKQELLLNKVSVIPNGIDNFWFSNINTSPKRLEDKKIRLIFAGRIDKNKNITTVQRAMVYLREIGYDATLTVVGKVEDEKEFALIQQDKHTTYIPAQPKEKLIEEYRKADLFVMPSFTESFGLVYAEAMTQGLPVIYSEKQGFDDQFPEGTVGYHVDPYSAKDTADGILKAVEHYSDIQKNVASKAKLFQWNVISRQYQTIYDNIIRNYHA